LREPKKIILAKDSPHLLAGHSFIFVHRQFAIKLKKFSLKLQTHSLKINNHQLFSLKVMKKSPFHKNEGKGIGLMFKLI
jgi:hypothetical protein